MNYQKLLLSVFSFALVLLLMVACSSTATPEESSDSQATQATTSAPEAPATTPAPEAEIPADTSTPISPTATPTPLPPTASPASTPTSALPYSENLEEKYEAFLAFVDSGETGVTSLLEMYESADLHTKYLILMALQRIDSEDLPAEDVLPVLLTSLQTEDDMLLSKLLAVLIKFDGEDLRPYASDLFPIVSSAITNPVKAIAEPATLLAGLVGTDDMIPILVSVINLPMEDTNVDKHNTVRTIAKVAISFVENKDKAFDALVDNLKYAKEELSTTNFFTKVVNDPQYLATVEALTLIVKENKELGSMAIEMAGNAQLPDYERSAAVSMLEGVDTGESKALLLEIIQDADAGLDLRKDAIFASDSFLAEDGEIETVLLNIAQNQKGEIQLAALLTLAIGAKENAVPLLVSLSEKGDQTERLAAILLSKYYPDDHAEINQLLLNGIADRGGDFNFNGLGAAIVLSQRATRNPQLITEILAQAEKNPSANMVEGILETINGIETEVIAEAGLQADVTKTAFNLFEEPGGCYNGALLLARLGPDSDMAEEILETLADSLDTNDICLGPIMKSVGGFGELSKEHVPVLVELANEGREGYYGTQEDALESLGILGPVASEAIPSLVALTASEKYGVPAKAIETMGLIGEAAVPELINLLEKDDLFIEKLQAIQEIGPAAKDAIPELTTLLEDTSYEPPVRAEIIFTLFAIEPELTLYQSNIDDLLNSSEYSLETKDTAISLLMKQFQIEAETLDILETLDIEVEE